MKKAKAFVVYENFKPWSFGPYVLLSWSDYYYFTSILECKKCTLRRLYHRFAAKELSKPQSSEWFNGPLRPNRYFHSIIRLIKVINEIEHRVRTNDSPEKRAHLRSLVCKEHASEVLQYMHHAADHDFHSPRIPKGVSSADAKWVHVILPKDHLELYHNVPPSSSPTPPVNTSSYPTKMVSKPGSESEAILLANWRWSNFYRDVDPENRQRKGVKHVSFPEGSPVTHTYSASEFSFDVREIKPNQGIIHGVSN
ncbi:hypothetical protein Aperf_G00000096023 [Anoplocephala perfoliata]